MSQVNPNATKTVLYELTGTAPVPVRRDQPYGGDDTLTMDIYAPTDTPDGARLPAVVIVAGYPDPGAKGILGCLFKDMGSTTSWARLIAASGMIAVAYTNREPVEDAHTLLRHVRDHAATLGIDETRIALWASSGNGPLAISLLTRDVTCAALCYACTIDLDGHTEIATASATYHFANPFAGKSMNDLPTNVPLFVARAGQDQVPGLNLALDRFLTAAVTHNLPITLTNHPTGPHAFDLFDDSPATREVVRQVLSFLRSHSGLE